MNRPTYHMKEKVWLYPSMHGMDGWHFVNVNTKVSRDIKSKYGTPRRGFGSIPVVVTAGNTVWNTSIFPDSKTDSYILPLKASVRRKEGISRDKMLSYSIELRF